MVKRKITVKLIHNEPIRIEWENAKCTFYYDKDLAMINIYKQKNHGFGRSTQSGWFNIKNHEQMLDFKKMTGLDFEIEDKTIRLFIMQGNE